MFFIRRPRIEDIQKLTKMLLANGVTPDGSDERQDYYVCINNDSICGYGVLINHEDNCLIKDVYVIEDYRRNKFGSSMVKAMLNSAEIHGVKTAFCFTSSKEFVEHLGFKPANVNEIPNSFKAFMNTKDTANDIYSVSLSEYFNCSCCHN